MAAWLPPPLSTLPICPIHGYRLHLACLAPAGLPTPADLPGPCWLPWHRLASYTVRRTGNDRNLRVCPHHALRWLASGYHYERRGWGQRGGRTARRAQQQRASGASSPFYSTIFDSTIVRSDLRKPIYVCMRPSPLTHTICACCVCLLSRPPRRAPLAGLRRSLARASALILGGRRGAQDAGHHLLPDGGETRLE